MKVLKTRETPDGTMKLKRKQTSEAPGSGPFWYIDYPGRGKSSSDYTSREQAQAKFDREYNARSGDAGANYPGDGSIF